jgi:hypothetical protein
MLLVEGWGEYHPRKGGGNTAINRIAHPLKNALNEDDANGYFNGGAVHNDYGVSTKVYPHDYIDFVFTFVDGTWCSGYRQLGHAHFNTNNFAKDIEIYTSNDMNSWTKVATDSHTNDYGSLSNDGWQPHSETEWTPSGPSKHLKVRTLSNHGGLIPGPLILPGALTVQRLQLKVTLPPLLSCAHDTTSYVGDGSYYCITTACANAAGLNGGGGSAPCAQERNGVIIDVSSSCWCWTHAHHGCAGSHCRMRFPPVAGHFQVGDRIVWTDIAAPSPPPPPS